VERPQHRRRCLSRRDDVDGGSGAQSALDIRRRQRLTDQARRIGGGQRGADQRLQVVPNRFQGVNQ